MKQLKFLTLIIAVFSYTASTGQTSYFTQFSKANKWSAGVQLSPNYSSNDADGILSFGGGAHVKYSLGQSFGLNLNADLGSLKGEKLSSSYEYTNKYKQVDITGMYTIGNISFIRPLRDIQLYTFFGLGIMFSDVNASFGEKGGNLADTKIENNESNAVVPIGFGLKKNINEKFDFGIEYKDNFVQGDMVDGYNYVTFANRNNDQYHSLNFKVSFKFGDKEQTAHMDWLNPLETIYEDIDSLFMVTAKLQNDSDKDGVADMFDQEAETDCDKVYGNGKAVDSDGDGVNDCKDLEPFSMSKDVDENGVAIDSDGDGVPDSLDEEPNSPAGEIVNVRGVAAKNGACCDCDNVTLPSVIFENGSARLAPSSFGILYSIAEKMKSCPGLTLNATGYTTSKAGEQIANKRSTAIVDHLEANYGIERGRIKTIYSTSKGVEFSNRRIDLGQVDN
jgi:outer membrane protein OmpA-like peptidoglycan-associated protein